MKKMKEENNNLSLFEAFGTDKLSETSENQFIRTFLIGQERERLKKLGTKHAKIRPLFNTTLYGRIAAALLVVGVPFFLWKSPSAKVFMDKALVESVTLPENLMSNAPATSWHRAYKAKQYDQVIKLLDEGNISKPDEIFYLGISSLQKKPADFEKAIRCFEKAQQMNKRTSELPWWLGVSYYHQGNLEKCKESLLQIQNGQFKYKEAQQILSKMKHE
jgi:tetratricopeptide (TPR) repeat protein